MEYTSAILVGNYLNRALSTNEAAMVNVLIPAVRIWIDKTLGTTFVEATEATVRYYDVEDYGKSIDIDPCQEISKIRTIQDNGDLNYEYVNPNEYVAYPLNETIKNEIRRRYGHWPVGLRRFEVTAKFSEYIDSIPSDIEAIATRIVAQLISGGGTTGGKNVQREELEGHSIFYQQATPEQINNIAMNDPVVQTTIQLRRDILIG